MQKNNEELLKAEFDIRREESYGGYQYKHNYDEYKKELIKKQVRKQGAWLTAIIIISFTVLILCITVLITDTVLKTKGSSFAALFGGDPQSLRSHDNNDLAEKAIDDISSQYTVAITADERTGAGIIITKDGYIATCYSLVKSVSDIRVTLKNGSVCEAVMAGYDETCDTAVLKIEAPTVLTTADIGYSRTLVAGQDVYCKDSPAASILKLKITSSNDTTFINTEPGCSVCGAPVINSHGQVVGICTARSGKVLHMDTMFPFIKKMLDTSSKTLSIKK